MTTNEPITLYQNIYFYKRKGSKQTLPYKYASQNLYSNKELAKKNNIKDWEEQKIDDDYELYTTITRLVIWKK